MKKCFACTCAGVCLCGLAIAAGEGHEFERPNQLLCQQRPFEVDLGVPERCQGEPAPHSRRAFTTSVTAVTSTSPVAMGWYQSWPTVSAVDAEDAAETADLKFPHLTSGADVAPPGSNIVERVPIYVLRGDDDPEQIG